MKKEKISTKSKIAATAVVIGSLLVGALGGALVADDSSQVQDMQSQIELGDANALALSNEIVNLNGELVNNEVAIEDFRIAIGNASAKIVELENRTPMVEIQEVEVLVEDTEMLSILCDRLMEEDISDCVNEARAEDGALTVAFEKITSEFLDEEFLEELEDDGFIEDDDEAILTKIYDNYDEIKILKSDYRNEEYKFKIKVRVDDEEADENKYFNIFVEVEDSEAKIIDVVAV